MTALFEEVIFGPVRSRRLGISLGVNLLPQHAKLCTFDCIYCECGWNAERRGERTFAHRAVVSERLEAKLQQMVEEELLPDVITFAGNGEPTMHPEFEAIIEDTRLLRDRYCPKARISVLSNATQLHRADVVRALKRVDNNILKLDSAFDHTVQRMNRPHQASYTVARIVEQLAQFDGDFILQTMFLRGECDGKPIDNTTPEEVAAWVALVEQLHPRQVMIYSIDRDTPCQTLERVSREELQQIAAQIEARGICCSVA